MNSSLSLAEQLRRAKRDLEKSVTSVARYMLHPIDSRTGTTRYLDRNGPADELYYFQPTAANRATFDKRVNAVRAQFPALQGDAQFIEMTNTALGHYGIVERLAAQRKEQLAQKRASVVAKRDERARLNLQEGVSLAGVDVGQYEVILAGLEPVRQHVYARRVETLNASYNAATELLAKHNFQLPRHATHTSKDRLEIRTRNEAHERLLEPVLRWYTLPYGHTTWTEKHDDVQATIRSMATQFALAYVQGYAVKLAGKIGEYIADELHPHKNVQVVRAIVSSPNLWSTSVCRIVVRFESGVEETVCYHTQMIWNQSVYGKQFNQWPTRLVK